LKCEKCESAKSVQKCGNRKLCEKSAESAGLFGDAAALNIILTKRPIHTDRVWIMNNEWWIMSGFTLVGDFALIIDYWLLITWSLTNAEAIMLKPFFIWQNKELKKINPEEVICLSTEGNYTRIYLADKTFYLVRSSLSRTLKKLPPEIFIKIHRSFIVAVHHISTIHKDHLVVRNVALPIAKRYYRSVLAKLNIIEWEVMVTVRNPKSKYRSDVIG